MLCVDGGTGGGDLSTGGPRGGPAFDVGATCPGPGTNTGSAISTSPLCLGGALQGGGDALYTGGGGLGIVPVVVGVGVH